MIRALCRSVFIYPCPRKLGEVVEMSLIEREPSDQVEAIWTKYHADRPNNVATTVTSAKYALFRKRAKESPFFILPVARDAGHFVLLLQAQGNSNLFTFLEDYKRNPSGATPYFVVTLFDELLLTQREV
jgi:ATP synthase F1 complex assembly factor 1